MVEGINTKDIVRLMAEEIFNLNAKSCPWECGGACEDPSDEERDCSYEDAISCWIKYFERKAKEDT